MLKRDMVLEQTLECLWLHRHPAWGDRTQMDVFNRLLAKSIHPHGWTANTHLDIREDQIVSRQEQWATNDLATLPRAHSEQRDSDAPIVLAVYDGMVRLLDGNHRINCWVAASDTRTHPVNIHTVNGTGAFIEVPSGLEGSR